MATEILSIAASAANSTDQVVAAGSTLTVGLKGTGGARVADNAVVRVFLKDDSGNYNEVYVLTGYHPSTVLPQGTYRFQRAAGVSCGVYSG